MSLATITLDSGRQISLTGFHAYRTHVGVLEGAPMRERNDKQLAGLPGEARVLLGADWPVHVVQPPRIRLNPPTTGDLDWDSHARNASW